MAALTSSDVTVTIGSHDREVVGVGPGKNFTIASIAFGDASKTYPTGGVPMPAIGSFGFHKIIDMMLIQQPSANGFVYKYDADNRKIKIFTQGVRTGSTAATTPGNGALIEDSAAAETAARLPNTAIDTDYDFGPLKEMAATIAPAAVTLKALVIGE